MSKTANYQRWYFVPPQRKVHIKCAACSAENLPHLIQLCNYITIHCVKLFCLAFSIVIVLLKL
jgi:hypothetical protein